MLLVIIIRDHPSVLSVISCSTAWLRVLFRLRIEVCDDAKSSARSAMFIATPATIAAKLRRSGMTSRSLGYRGRRLGRSLIHAAPTELGRTSFPVRTISMALLTELDGSPPRDFNYSRKTGACLLWYSGEDCIISNKPIALNRCGN